MSDFQPLSPGRQPDDGAESSSSNVVTEPTLGPVTFGLPRLPSQSTSGGATPTRAPVQAPLDMDLSALRQGQADANANMERFMSMNANILEYMRTSQEDLRRNLEERLNLFAQHVQVPVMQAVNTSTAAANLTNEMAGAYVTMREELTSAFNAAQQANSAAEANQLETQCEAELSRTALAEATAALAASRPASTSMATVERQATDISTTAERLAAQLADLSTQDAQA
jgi:hypothetical protein